LRALVESMDDNVRLLDDIAQGRHVR
jgi:hypothetical protein